MKMLESQDISIKEAVWVYNHANRDKIVQFVLAHVGVFPILEYLDNLVHDTLRCSDNPDFRKYLTQAKKEIWTKEFEQFLSNELGVL